MMTNAVPSSDPVRAFLIELSGRIVRDFGLERWSTRDREIGLQKLGARVLEFIAIESLEQLTEAEQEQVTDLASPQNEEAMLATLAYLITRLGERWSIVVDRAYEQVVAIAVKSMEQNTHQALGEAEKLEELIGAGSSVIEIIEEARGSESGAISVTTAAMELLFDPARAVRTPEQRQARFFLKAREMMVKALVLIWSSALLFTIMDTLARYRIINEVPAIFKSGLPSWLFAATLTAQWRLFGVLTLGIIAALVLVGLAAASLTRSKRATKLFEIDIADEDYATYYLIPALRELFGSDAPPETLKSTSDLIYRTVYIDSGRESRDELAVLSEMLKLGDEKRVIVFLKSKIRGYRDALRRSVESFARDARHTMGGIS
jgi:hypothetical protein